MSIFEQRCAAADRFEPGGKSPITHRTLVVTGALTLWCLGALVLPHTARTSTWLPTTGRYLAAELFILAGMARLASWRMSRSTDALRSAVALLAIGLTLPTLAFLTPWILDATHATHAAALARLIVSTPILAIFALGGRAAPWSPFGRILVGVGLVTLPVLALDALSKALRGPFGASALLVPATVIAELILASAWMTLAVRSRGRSARWIPFAMVVMATGEFVRAVAIVVNLKPDVAAGFSLVAGLVFAGAAGTELWSMIRTERADSTELCRTLVDTQRRLAVAEQVQHERVHDARSAVLGMLGASSLLSRPATARDRERLRQLIVSELTRLHTLLDVDAEEAESEFDLADVLAPVVLTHRVADPTILVDIPHLSVRGRPHATATVLDNLLRNARTHAPGAAIWVRAEATGDSVAVRVEDDGPGIPATELAAVLQAGVRGSTARGNGSGLGLHTCAQSLAAQSGTLRVTARSGGGTCATFDLAVGVPRAVQPSHAVAS